MLPTEEDLIIFLAISFVIYHAITPKFSALKPQFVIISSGSTGAYQSLVVSCGTSGVSGWDWCPCRLQWDGCERWLSQLPWISVLLQAASPLLP